MTVFLRVLFAAILITAGFAGYKVWRTGWGFSVVKSAPQNQSIGPEDSERILVEFLDYRCGACREIHKEVQAFIERNPDVRVIFRHYPILGRASVFEARLAMAAGKQGQFKEMHELLITRAHPVEEEELPELAAQLGLIEQQLWDEMYSEDITNTLLETVDAAKAMGFNSTPVFVAGKMIQMPEGRLPNADDLEALMTRAEQ